MKNTVDVIRSGNTFDQRYENVRTPARVYRFAQLLAVVERFICVGLESVRKKLQPAADVTRKFSLVMKNTVDVIRSGNTVDQRYEKLYAPARVMVLRNCPLQRNGPHPPYFVNRPQKIYGCGPTGKRSISPAIADANPMVRIRKFLADGLQNLAGIELYFLLCQ